MIPRRLARLAITAALLLAASPAWGQWTATIERPQTNPKRSKEAFAWVPDGCKQVHGVFIAQQTMFEAGIARNAEVWAACADKGIAVVYAPCGIGLTFLTPIFNTANFHPVAGKDVASMAAGFGTTRILLWVG